MLEQVGAIILWWSAMAVAGAIVWVALRKAAQYSRRD